MTTPKSQNTALLLRQLFSGDAVLRDQALLSVAPHEREAVRELVAVRQEAELLFQAMRADMASASAELRNDFNNQFRRRTAIRTLAATVDGTIFVLKQLALASARVTGARLDTDKIQFLQERQISPELGKVRLPGFRDNFKRTFKLFAEVHGIPCPTDFGREGFEFLCATFELRHRVTHPKLFTAFFVQDEETERAGLAIDWLNRELYRLLDACRDALGKR